MFVYDRVCTFSCFFSGLLIIVSKIFFGNPFVRIINIRDYHIDFIFKSTVTNNKKCQFLIAYHLNSHT